MADIKQLAQEYLKSSRIMQLATSSNNKPWACNVHFYADDENNIYWASTPARRHSQDIEQNSNVAITIKIHEDTPEERYVIGLSAEGTASLLTKEETAMVGKDYIAKLGRDQSVLEDILSGKNPNVFYKLKVSNFVLFDTKNFPENPRQEVQV